MIEIIKHIILEQPTDGTTESIEAEAVVIISKIKKQLFLPLTEMALWLPDHAFISKLFNVNSSNCKIA